MLGKLCGDLVLVLPALGQDVMQPLATWEAVHPIVIEQGPQGRACQSTSRFEQGIKWKADVSGLLPLRPIDKPDRCAVIDQAKRDVGLVEEPLELLLGRLAPAGLIDLHWLAIEIDVRGHFEPYQAPGCGMLGLLGPAVGEGWLQDVRVVAELVLQFRGWLRPLSRVGCLLTGKHPGSGHGAVQLKEVRLPTQELSQERFQTAKQSGPFLLVVFIVVRRNRNGHGQGVESTLGIACLERELDLGRTERRWARRPSPATQASGS